MEDILILESLTKRFKDLVAVDKVSFSIAGGEFFGLLGPNGAGKTTIIKMLCTLLNPSGGSAKVNGFDIRDDRDSVRESIGVVFQDPSTDEELTAWENMMFHGLIYGLGKATIGKRINELLHLVELLDTRDKLVKEFSGGMRRRLEIARSLLHKPKVLFLDEPTVGLDPQTRSRIWSYLTKLNKEGVTMILTTHYMEEAERLCSRLAIIDRGKVIAMGTPDALKETLEGDTLEVAAEDPDGIKKLLKDDKGIKKIICHDKMCTIITKNGDTKIPDIVRRCERCGISSINLHKPTLEDVFLHFTGRTIREEAAQGFVEKVRMMRRR